MYNIKLKSVPNKAKTGSQLDYSLVDRNTLFLKPNTPVDSDVKNTMGAVPRDKANIEAEGGETVIGDINNDGFLEHQTIVGKRHTQGGVPLNVPEGSFIFSDTKKMTIKDPEVLAIFGMKPSKAGYTPAEIAKRYNINDYIAILKDPAKDKYAKETAQIMLQSNLKKLGMLALIQESMKGFPDGVPAIAESVMGQMQGGQEQQGPEEEAQEAPEEQGPQEEMMEEQPMQRYGGTQLPKAQVGLNNVTSSGNPTTNFKIYKGLTPVTVLPITRPQVLANNPGQPYIKLSDGTRFTKKEFDLLVKNGSLKNKKRGFNDVYSTKPLISKTTIKDSDGNPIKGFDVYSGDIITYNNKNYTVIDPLAEGSSEYSGSSKMWRDVFDNTHGIIHVKNDKGEDEFLEGEDLGDAYKFDKDLVKVMRSNAWKDALKKSEDANNTSTKAPDSMNPDTGTANQKAAARAAAQREAARIAQKKAAEVNARNEQEVAPEQPAPTVDNQPRVKVRIKTPPQNVQPTQGTINGVPIETTNEFAYGGGIPQYQVAGTTTQPQASVQQQSPPERKIVKYMWSTKSNKMYAIDDKGDHFETPYTKLITKERVVDPTTKTVKEVFYASFPDNMSSKERSEIVDSIDSKSNIGIASQHSNQRLNPKNPYKRFYGNTRPQDYEDKIVRKNLGDQATDAMDEVTKRKKAFEILGIKDVADTDLKDAARLYNDPYFFDKQFLPAFQSKLPEGTYRPQWGDHQGKVGFEYLKAFNVPDKPADQQNNNNTNVATVNKPYTQPNFRDNGWWIQDRLNLAGVLTDPVNAYFPALSHHSYMTPGYVLNDPTTQLRAVQQGVNSLQNQAFNSMSGNTAMATSFGLTGQGIDKSADILGNNNNSNVGIVNNFSNNVAGIYNRGVDQNQNDISTYMANTSRTLENLDKANQFKKWRGIAAMNTGITNWQKKNEYEQMFKNVTIDPITGRRYIHGNDKAELNDDMSFAYSPYQNPWTAGSSASSVNPDLLYKEYRKNMTHQEAVDMVNLHIRNSAASRGGRSTASSGYGYGSQGAVSPGAYGATAGSAYGYDELEG